MDLRLFGQVIWRFRVIFVVGVLAAFLLAALSMVRVQLDKGLKLSYRQSQVYQSDVLLSVDSRRGDFGAGSAPVIDPGGWLSQLAVIYAQHAQDDDVQRQIPAGGFERVVTAAPVMDARGRNALPFITVSGASTSARDAVRTAHSGAEVLIGYIGRVLAAGTAPDRRAVVRISKDAGAPVVIQPRKKTVPIFIFLVFLIATIGLIMVLENMRPKPSQAAVPLRGDPNAGAAEEKKKSAGSGDAS